MDTSLPVLALLVLGVGWVIFRRPNRSGKPEFGTLAGPGTFKVEVVGESHYQAALEAVCGGRTEDGAEKHCRATLVLEDSNPYDCNAVRIDVDGATVGYLPRDSAKVYRQRLKEAATPNSAVHAMLSSGAGGTVGTETPATLVSGLIYRPIECPNIALNRTSWRRAFGRAEKLPVNLGR